MVPHASRPVTYRVTGTGTVTEIDDATGHERPIPAEQLDRGHPKRGMVDKDGRLWIIKTNCLWRFEPRTGRWSELRPLDQHGSNEPMEVKCLFQDRSGVIWIGTIGYGLYIYDPRSERFHTQGTGSSFWMASLTDGRVAIAATDKIHVFDPERSSFAHASGHVMMGTEMTSPYLWGECSFVNSPTGMVWSFGDDKLCRRDERHNIFTCFNDPGVPVRFPLHAYGDSLIAFGSLNALGLFDTRSKRFMSVPYPVDHSGGNTNSYTPSNTMWTAPSGWAP